MKNVDQIDRISLLKQNNNPTSSKPSMKDPRTRSSEKTVANPASQTSSGASASPPRPPHYYQPARRVNPSKSRFISRDLPFHQSTNKIRVSLASSKFRSSIMNLMQRDWFHLSLRLRTIHSFFFLLVIWTSIVIAFAMFYMAVDRVTGEEDCGLSGVQDVYISFSSAFSFSLETATTVGYGLPGSSNGFFNNCWPLQMTIYFQMVTSLVFNAFLFAFVFARLARAERRGFQVVWSNKAVVRKTDKGYQLDVRVFDVDAEYPLVEAHVRLYTIRHKGVEEGALEDVKFDPVRITVPNDEITTSLFVSLPNVVRHHIDRYSSLLPPAKTLSSTTSNAGDPANGVVTDSSSLLLREMDEASGSRSGYQCTVCGESGYSSLENLRRHVKFNAKVERQSNIKGCHDTIDLRKLVEREEGDVDDLGFERLEEFWLEEDIEIIGIFEAIDPLMGCTFQSLQSWTCDDIVFGARHANCVATNAGKRGKTIVDLEQFHELDYDNEQ
jgi:hypothetical protein